MCARPKPTNKQKHVAGPKKTKLERKQIIICWSLHGVDNVESIIHIFSTYYVIFQPSVLSLSS